MSGHIHFLTLTLVGTVFIAGCKTSGPVDLTQIPKGKTVVTGGGGTIPPGGGTDNKGPGGGNTLPDGNNVNTTNRPGGKGGDGGNTGGDPVVDYRNPIVDRASLSPQTVLFDYDSASVRPNETAKVDAVAQYLAKQPTHLLLIEGHCDERGTEQYNMSLGEKRALAIRDRLVQLGINTDRIKTVSYGEEVPAATGVVDAERSQNRRGQFVVVKPGPIPAAP